MSQVEVGLHTIRRHITLTVFVRIERPRVDVDIGVELLNRDLIATCLQQFTDAGGNDAFAKRGNHTACDEYIFCFHNLI